MEEKTGYLHASPAASQKEHRFLRRPGHSSPSTCGRRADQMQVNYVLYMLSKAEDLRLPSRERAMNQRVPRALPVQRVKKLGARCPRPRGRRPAGRCGDASRCRRGRGRYGDLRVGWKGRRRGHPTCMRPIHGRRHLVRRGGQRASPLG